jgi:hypothetical protein
LIVRVNDATTKSIVMGGSTSAGQASRRPAVLSGEGEISVGNIEGFLPSQNGLHFQNQWPPIPELNLTTRFGDIPIGDAANGLCGGMAFAVRDLFESGRLPPASHQNPAAGSPAYQFIVERLFHSFDIPAGVARYYELMNLPPADTLTVLHDGLAWQTIQETMPSIRATIDAGHLCPIGLIRVHSSVPAALGQNHQVLVWGYEDDGPTTRLRLYDCNQPDNDTVSITFDHTHPGQATTFSCPGIDPILGFFVSEYESADPSRLFLDGHNE